MRHLVIGLVASSALGLLAIAPAAAAAPPAIRLDVDARDAGKHLFHAHETLAVTAGTVALAYPKWIPGEHGPTGPIADLAGLQISAGGKPLSWRRDPMDMFVVRVDVPAGTTALTIDLELLSPTGADGFSSGSSATSELALVSWNQLVLYPATAAADAITVAASLRLPSGWTHGSALVTAKHAGDTVTFAPVTLTTLIDSPVLSGAHTRALTLSSTPPVTLFAAADSAAALEFPADLAATYQALVAEAMALFGARHFEQYTFLVTLSDEVAHFGLEHHQSSDDRLDERAFTDGDARRIGATLLAHELTHSWNGKYRRPSGLATTNYEQPMDGSLLWVYEGLTEYLGWVLATRAGVQPIDDARARLAENAAYLDSESGRTWRPLADTAVAAQVLYAAPSAWSSRRRGVDFYPEGLLVWLEIDTIIRRESKGTRSLDDFCRQFFGGADSGPAVVPYTRDDVAAALGQIVTYDWKGLLAARIDGTDPHAPLGGVVASGWKLGWSADRPDLQKTRESVSNGTNVWYSIGLELDKSGELVDVRAGSPADRAGLSPGSKLIASNGRAWTAERLRAIIAATKTSKKLDLLVESGEFFRTFTLGYAGGDRYPVLVRDDATTDVLSQILAAHRK